MKEKVLNNIQTLERVIIRYVAVGKVAFGFEPYLVNIIGFTWLISEHDVLNYSTVGVNQGNNIYTTYLRISHGYVHYGPEQLLVS